MRISPEQYKKFKRFANFLISEDHNGLEWTTYVYDGYDMDTAHGPNSRGYKVDGIENFREEVGILETIIEEQLPKIDLGKYMMCDDCTGNGTITVTFDVETMSLNFEMDVETTVTHEHTKEISFNKISKQEASVWTRYENLQLLGKQEFIDEIKDKYGEEITVEYDGGGDSGYIQEDENVPSIMNDISLEILDSYYSGWEINEGSNGNIFYDFKNQMVFIDHNLYETENFNVEIGEIKLTQ